MPTLSQCQILNALVERKLVSNEDEDTENPEQTDDQQVQDASRSIAIVSYSSARPPQPAQLPLPLSSPLDGDHDVTAFQKDRMQVTMNALKIVPVLRQQSWCKTDSNNRWRSALYLWNIRNNTCERKTTDDNTYNANPAAQCPKVNNRQFSPWSIVARQRNLLISPFLDDISLSQNYRPRSRLFTVPRTTVVRNTLSAGKHHVTESEVEVDFNDEECGLQSIESEDKDDGATVAGTQPGESERDDCARATGTTPGDSEDIDYGSRATGTTPEGFEHTDDGARAATTTPGEAEEIDDDDDGDEGDGDDENEEDGDEEEEEDDAGASGITPEECKDNECGAQSKKDTSEKCEDVPSDKVEETPITMDKFKVPKNKHFFNVKCPEHIKNQLYQLGWRNPRKRKKTKIKEEKNSPRNAKLSYMQMPKLDLARDPVLIRLSKKSKKMMVYTEPPEKRPRAVCFDIFGAHLTHLGVWKSFQRDVLSEYEEITIESIQFTPRSIFLPRTKHSEPVENRWVITLTNEWFRSRVTGMKIHFGEFETYLRRYDDVTSLEYRQYTRVTHMMKMVKVNPPR